MEFMIRIKYRCWAFFLTFIITLAPLQQLHAAVTQFTDDKGTIHINNIAEDKTKLQNKDYNVSGQHKNSEVVNLDEPMLSNIFTKNEDANALLSSPAFPAPTPEP
jgi:hypothetical protein